MIMAKVKLNLCNLKILCTARFVLKISKSYYTHHQPNT